MVNLKLFIKNFLLLLLFCTPISVSWAVTSLQSDNFTAAKTTIGHIDLVVVNKSTSIMTLKRNGEDIRNYKVALGGQPQGHKVTEGDQRTPEGRYKLDYKKSDSAYYRAIHISYPNEEDILRAEALGLNPGGQIMIHGQDPNSSLTAEQAQKINWTNGCIAITNEQMDELWQAIELGTPIEIWP